MNSNEVSESEVELISTSASSALALPPDAGLALVAERLVDQAVGDGDGAGAAGRVESGGAGHELVVRVLAAAVNASVMVVWRPVRR